MEPIKIVLCSGIKDTAIIYELGFIAIALNSETSLNLPKRLEDLLFQIQDLYYLELELVILYDIDKTGAKSAQELMNKYGDLYNMRIVTLPKKLKESGGNDVGDWIELGFSTEELIDLINDNVLTDEPQSPISPKSAFHDCSKKDLEHNSICSGKANEGKLCGSISQKEEIEETGDTKVLDGKLNYLLPQLFQSALAPIKLKHQEMMLFAFLVSIGSVIRNVSAKYGNHNLYPNLFSMVIAPAASGKSQIKWARSIILSVEKYIINRSKQRIRDYEQRIKECKEDISETTEKPKYEVLIISDNITSAMLIYQLSQNDGKGFIFGTEMDSLADSNDSHKKLVDEILRKASEGEPISVMRRKNNERLNIECATLSLLLSGTPGQFTKFIRDSENGLFSRILPYCFEGDNNWLDKSLCDNIDLDNHYEVLSNKVLEYHKMLIDFKGPINFKFYNSQLKTLNEEFSDRLNKATKVCGERIRATVFRQGAMTIKIAMILGVIRNLENGNLSSTIHCSSNDFNTALAITGVALTHSIRSLKLLNEDRIENSFRGRKLDFFYALPTEFTFNESQTLALVENIKLKTAEKWIYSFRNKGFLHNPTKGFYRKAI